MAKRKEEEPGCLPGQRTRTIRRYFCIKQFETTEAGGQVDQNKYSQAKAKLVNEMVALSSLQCADYVQEFEEFVKTDHNFWLVQPFYNGGNLGQLIDEHRYGLDLESLRHVTFQILDAFALLLRKNLL